MPFSKSQKKSIKGNRECLWCGWKQSFLDGVHLVDEIDKPAENGVWLCKNCHAVFEDVFRPRLFKALVAYGIPAEKLPPSWRKSNKMSSE
jgi:Zn-finger protein